MYQGNCPRTHMFCFLRKTRICQKHGIWRRNQKKKKKFASSTPVQGQETNPQQKKKNANVSVGGTQRGCVLLCRLSPKKCRSQKKKKKKKKNKNKRTGFFLPSKLKTKTATFIHGGRGNPKKKKIPKITVMDFRWQIRNYERVIIIRLVAFFSLLV